MWADKTKLIIAARNFANECTKKNGVKHFRSPFALNTAAHLLSR